MIDHTLLDIHEKAQGDPDQVPAEERHVLGPNWTTVDELLLDLHMIRHGYTTEGYEKHVERRLKEECVDDSVVERLKRSRY